jgi:hypothetical protein
MLSNSTGYNYDSTTLVNLQQRPSPASAIPTCFHVRMGIRSYELPLKLLRSHVLNGLCILWRGFVFQ